MGLRVLFLAGLLALASTGCIDRSAWTTCDSWYHPAEPQTPPASQPSQVVLPRSSIHPVISARQAQAQEMLKDVAILELSASQASDFAGLEIPQTSPARPYLVRAVVLNEGTGGFSACLDSQQLFVHHWSLGRHAVPMKRKALVLLLPYLPKEVFVVCSMAE